MTNATVSQDTPQPSLEVPRSKLSRYDSMPLVYRVAFVVLTVLGLAFFLLYLGQFSINGWVLEQPRYYYILYATFGTVAFLGMAARPSDKKRLPVYDQVIAIAVFGVFTYLATQAVEIMTIRWVPPRDNLQLGIAIFVALVSLEAGRRLAGWPFTVICVVFGIYPMVAEWMPGFLNAGSFPVENVLAAFAYGKSGILGLPAEVTGDVLIGYLIFGSIILNCGAGDFFVRFALSVFGRFRGGSAKVAIMTSALFGMMSGSPIANAVTTGTLTIPTMKRYGYPPHYAGAIEAVAGNGGIIMPPVMGTVIFIMVILTGVTYAEVVIAALLPAILYYAGLFVQVDAYAAKSGLVGIPKAEIPSLRSALKMGWPTIIVIGFLVYALMFLRWSQTAPVFAAGLAILLSFTSRKYRMTPRKLLATTINMGETIAFIMATVLPAAYIILGLDLTGTVMAITARIVSMAEGSTILVLALAALLCYIFGFIGLSIVPYIVLAVTMVPAMVKGAGLDLVSVHLFLIYWLITANITPPVAILAFVCAAIAGAPPMKTGWTATRLAIVVYFVPFFFVLNPALILKGPVELIILYFVTALAGIWVLGSGMEGYLQFLGLLPWWSRVMLIIGGFLLAFPDWILTIVGLAIIAVAVLAILAIKRFKAARPAPG